MKIKKLESNILIATDVDEDSIDLDSPDVLRNIDNWCYRAQKKEEIPPIIIGHYTLVTNHENYDLLIEGYGKELADIVESGADYIILHGNQKAFGIILAGGKIPCLEICNEEDLDRITVLYDERGMGQFPHQEEYYSTEFCHRGGYKPSTIAYALVDFGHIKGIMSDMVDKAIKEKTLTERLIDGYRKRG